MPHSYTQPDRSARECRHWWFDHWNRLVNGALGLAGTPSIRLQPGEIAIDTHVHTLFSHCSITQPEVLIRWAVKIGLGAICIMDHNDTRGCEDAVRCADYLKENGIIPEDFLIIPGIEVNSNHGHVGGMFITEKIKINMPPADTVKAVHDLGGIAVAPHPYHSTGVCDDVYNAPFDAVEVECGSIFAPDLVTKNRELISDPRLQNAAKLGASDGHYVRAVGACYTVIKPDEVTLDGVRRALESRQTVAVASTPCRKMQSLLGRIPKLK